MFQWKPYVSVATRRAQAARELARLAKRKGGAVASPVRIEGRTIAHTFWGKAWCENLERYSDYANRLPRGRTYVRNGSVVDLQITAGAIAARVSGSSLYHVNIEVAAVPADRWSALCGDCVGAIDSLVELLQGRFSKGVMERLCQPKVGLFPAPTEIALSCSCPDWAGMCKHVAAVMYGIGARLDERPELLFTLRQVDHADLIASAGRDAPLSKRGPTADRVVQRDDLGALFGLELAEEEDAEVAAAAPPKGVRSKPKAPVKAAAKAPAKAAAKPKRGATAVKPPPAAKKPAARPKAAPARKR